MKNYKYRAWDNKEKKWLLGYEYPNLGGFSLFGEIMLMGEWANILNQYLFDRDGHKAEDLMVTEFTGLLDKNGKEVYDGDILQRGDTIFKVCFNDDCVGFYLEDYTSIRGNKIPLESRLAAELYLIGNIYENSELLK